MISVILFFLLVCSGSVLAAAFRNRRFEEVLPLTCTGTVLILYVCGLLGALALGAALVCVLAVCAYIAAGIRLCRTRGWKRFAGNFVTLPFLAFTLLYILLIFFHYGRLAYEWDEFSHWMYVVKTMAILDDFAANPAANAPFASYPPGMALFQYILQKLYQWADGGYVSEWRAFLAYQTFLLAFLLPFTGKLTVKKPLTAFVGFAAMVLCPAISFGNVYTSIYIDPFLGVVSGAGLAQLFLQKKWDALSSVQLFAKCFILVLAKDVGLLLAVFLSAGYVLSLWFCDQGENPSFTRGGKIAGSALAVAAFALPRLSWRAYLKSAGSAIAFSEPYHLAYLLGVITGRDASPRSGVWNHFFRTFATGKFAYGQFGISLSFLGLLVLTFLVWGALAVFFIRKKQITRKKTCLLFLLTALEYAVYIVGLCFTYLTRFTDQEAVVLASFRRYLSIQFLGGLTMLLALTVTALPEIRFRRTASALTLAALILTAPLTSLRSLADRESVSTARNHRRSVSIAVEGIETYTPPDSRIWFVTAEGKSYYIWMTRFVIYPRLIPVESLWDMCVPNTENGSLPTAEQWREELVRSFDYVVPFQINQVFLDRYACLFADPENIVREAVYRVNKDTGLLEKCGP